MLDLASQVELRPYRDKLARAGVRGLVALDALPTVSSSVTPGPAVRASELFQRAVSSVKLPLNRKTTQQAIVPVRLAALEPSQDLVPVRGLESYVIRPRRDPPDVAHVVMRDGRDRWIVQEGHTRLGAALLRGDTSLPARVWEFMQDATGAVVPVLRTRGLHRRGLGYRDRVQSLADREYTRDEKGQFASGGGSVADQMATLKEKYPVVAKNYRRSSGTEMGSIEAHTGDVGREWAKQLTPAEMTGISTRFGSDVGKLMAAAIPLHDIGKPDALAEGQKSKQHEHTVPILQEVLRQEGFSEKDVTLATELLNHDLIGPLLRANEGVRAKQTPQQVADTLTAKAKTVGMDVSDFATLQVAFYQADASAYPYVTRFMTKAPSGKWHFDKAKPLAPIRALIRTPTKVQATDGDRAAYRDRLALLLDAEREYVREPDGRFAETGGGGERASEPSERSVSEKPSSHADKPSVKGKNITRIADHADDAAVEQVLGLDSQAAVRDLAESMVQYADQEQFSVTISSEGGGPSQDELQEGYDEYRDHEAYNARSEAVADRTSRQAEIIAIWEQMQDEARTGPYGDVREHPTLPGEEFHPVERGGVGGEKQVPYDELIEGLDPTSAFSDDEKATIRERLRDSGGPMVVSVSQMRREWEAQNEDFEPPDSFDDWASGRGSGGDDNASVRLEFSGSDGTTIKRAFTRDSDGELVADHEFFKTGHTGGGLAKDVLRASFDEYKKLGVDKVTVHANIDVGGYAWAKFGFVPSESSAREVERSLDGWISDAVRRGKLTAEDRRVLEDVATDHAGERTLIWKIADAMNGDKKLGPAVLMNNDWYGEIRLDDRRAMGRLQGYLEKPSPAEKPASAPVPASPPRTEAEIQRGMMDRINAEHAAYQQRLAKAERPVQRIADVPQAFEKATRENAARDARDAAISRRHAEAEAAIERAAHLPVTGVEDALRTARRHADEIQEGFDQLHNDNSPHGQEQRDALASQERATNARIRSLEKQQRKQVEADRAAQNANRKRLGLNPINFAADKPKVTKPPKVKPKTPSAALYYDKADGTRGDRDLWRDLLGEDFPEDTPSDAPKRDLTNGHNESIIGYRDKLATVVLDWDEGAHPRDDAGKFTGDGNGGSAAEKSDTGAGGRGGGAAPASATRVGAAKTKVDYTDAVAKGRPDANPEAHGVANSYNAQHGLPPVTHGYVPVDERQAHDIADAYEALPDDDRQNPVVREAYAALTTEVQAQWDHIIATGMHFEPWTQDGQPYRNSSEMAKDVQANQHLYFFTGGEPHPLLDAKDPKTGLSVNEQLRAVHDYFGHAAGGYGFGARGEENAWLSHSQMLSPQARRALTTETRGQNSWVNQGRQNYNADGTYKNIPPADRPYAKQKVALLPDKYVFTQEELVQQHDRAGKSLRAIGRGDTARRFDEIVEGHRGRASRLEGDVLSTREEAGHRVASEVPSGLLRRAPSPTSSAHQKGSVLHGRDVSREDHRPSRRVGKEQPTEVPAQLGALSSEAAGRAVQPRRDGHRDSGDVPSAWDFLGSRVEQAEGQQSEYRPHQSGAGVREGQYSSGVVARESAEVRCDGRGTGASAGLDAAVASLSYRERLTFLLDADREYVRDEAGRFASTGSSPYAAEPRVFNTPDEVVAEKNWGKTQWAWKNKPGLLLTGEPIDRKDLPETLYHVTVNAPAIESSGVLLGQRADGGMGGGQADGVSFTTSKEDARVIQRELIRSVKIARGDDDGMTAIERYAREDEKEAGLPTGTLDHAVEFAKSGWDAGQHSRESTWKDGAYHPEIPLPKDEFDRLRRSSTKDALNAYLQIRGHHDETHPILKNPILFGRQDKLKLIDPKSISTLTVPTKNIPQKALVTTGSDKFLHEVRVYADVPSGGTTATVLSYRDRLALFLLGDTEGHPFRGNQWTDIGGGDTIDTVDSERYSDSGARGFKGNEGYDWHERPEMEEYVKTLPHDDVEAITDYASFGYRDVNNDLRGSYEPPIISEFVREATPKEIESYTWDMGHRDATDYKPENPNNKVGDGRLIHNVFTKDPNGNTVEWSIQRAVPDLKRAAEVKDKADRINAAIKEHGYVLPETITVNRAAYIPNMSLDDVQGLIGKVIEEKGFTSTMVGDPGKRLNGYVAIAKSESIRARYPNEDDNGRAKHDYEKGAAMRIQIVLPKGMKVAPVESVRRTDYEYPRIQDPEAFKHPEWLTKDDGTPNGLKVTDYKIPNFAAVPKVDVGHLRDKNYRSEAEVLLGSGAHFQILSAYQGSSVQLSGQREIPVIDVKMLYVGGGSSDLPTPKPAHLTSGHEYNTIESVVQLGDVEGHPFRGNQWTRREEGGDAETRREAAAATRPYLTELIKSLGQPDGGFTVHTTSGVVPAKGFAVSIHRDREVVIPATKIKPRHIVDFIMKNHDLLALKNRFVGAWHNPENGQVYLDVSKVVNGAGEARHLARTHDQYAYFNLAKGKSVNIGKRTDDG